MLETATASAEDIDTAMKGGCNFPMGPLALIDLIGVDVSIAIGEALYADSNEEHHRPPGRLTSMAGEGKLGRKSGSGFYDY